MNLKRILTLVLALALTFSLVACAGDAGTTGGDDQTDAEVTTAAKEQEDTGNGTDKEAGITVAYSMKTLQEERWQRELEFSEKFADELGVNFIYQVANNDSNQQISQIENLLTQDIDVLLVTPVDSGALSNVLAAATEQGVYVVGYDQECEDVFYDAFVGYSAYSIGTQFSQMAIDFGVTSGNFVFLYGDAASGTAVENMKQGMWDTLQDYIDAGDIDVVMDQYCEKWSAEAGLAHAENAISSYGEDLAAFICMNDGIANGVVQALTAAGMENKGIVVTGQDCELTAVQRIAAGTQTATLYKDSEKLAKAVLTTAVKLANGESLDATETINLGRNDAPWVVADTVVVDKDTYRAVVIDGGVFTEEEVMGG